MAYATNADIEERLGSALYVQLTDDSGSGSADEDKIDEARLGAEGEVNSFLARRHEVPIDLTSHPELSALLKSVTLDLIEFRLHARRPPIPAVVAQKRELALRWLGSVASGEVVLPSVAVLPSNPAGAFDAEVSGAPRVLSRESLEDL